VALSNQKCERVVFEKEITTSFCMVETDSTIYGAYRCGEDLCLDNSTPNRCVPQRLNSLDDNFFARNKVD
jgi:hypothetical protein